VGRTLFLRTGVLSCLCAVLRCACGVGADTGGAEEADASVVHVPLCVTVPFAAAVLCALRAVVGSWRVLSPGGAGSGSGEGALDGTCSVLVAPLAETVCALWRLRRHIITGDVDEGTIASATGARARRYLCVPLCVFPVGAQCGMQAAQRLRD
jgi:hypothetical protein